MITACLLHVVPMIEVAESSDLQVAANPPGSKPPGSKLNDGRSDDSDDASIAKLIVQLGDKHYIVRDEAETKLLKIGGPAIQLLRNATSHRVDGRPDSEIRLRATRLLILLERKERQRRIQEFLDGKDNDLDLRGWTEFSKNVGSDRTARKLFIGMHDAQPDLLATINQDKRSVEEAYRNASRRSLRSNSFSNATQTIGTLTAMLFVATLEFESVQDQSRNKISVSLADIRRIQSVLIQTPVISFVKNSSNKNQIGKLVSNWLDTLPDDENASVIVKLSVIGAYQLTDQLELVTKFANNRRLPPPTRFTAIELFSILATKDDSPKLSPLLNDPTVVGNYLPRNVASVDGAIESDKPHVEHYRTKLMQVQIRDLALATLLKLKQQDPVNFGFDPRCFSGDKLIRNYAGFFTEEDRKTAFDKWAK